MIRNCTPRSTTFVYFKSIALEPTRLAKLKPFVLAELTAELADTESASRFIFLVPNQCNDQHGAPAAPKPSHCALATLF